MADIPVTIRLRADGKGLRGDLAVTDAELKKLEGSLNRTSRGTKQLQTQSGAARAQLLNMAKAAAAAGAALAVRRIIQTADEMARLNARLNLVTESSEEFARAQQFITDAANESGRPIQAVGELYVRLNQALRDNATSQGEIEIITRAVTQSMRVSGASVTESAGAIRQLSQAFAAGVLRGDEFNSVNEQAPRLMQALADSLGVTRGELRGLAEDGELTAEILQEALIDQSGEIAREAAQIPQTVGEAYQVLKNSLSVLIGNFDQATGASNALAGIVSGLGETIGNAADFIAENSTNIRLAGIAMVRGVLLAFEELRGGFEFLKGVATEQLTFIADAFYRVVQAAAGAAAALVEISAKANGLIPGLGGVAESQRDLALSLRQTEEDAENSIVGARGLGEVWRETRARVDAAKQQIRQITDDMADQAIAAGEAAGATGELADSTDRVRRAAEAAGGPTKELVESFDDLLGGLRDQIESLREQELRLRGGTEAVLDYRRAQLIASGATEDMIDAFDRVSQELLEQEDSLRTTRAEYEAFEQTAQRMAERMLELTMRTLGFGDAAGRSADQLNLLQRAGNQIGSNFAQALVQGQDIRPALADSFRAFAGEGLGDALGDAFGEAFENIGENENFQAGIQTAALVIGEAIEGNIGQAAASAVGAGIGFALGGPGGAQIGAFIGNLIGELVFGESVPKFQVRGTQATRSTDEGTDLTVDGALGQIEFAFRGIGAEAQRQVVEGFVRFDETMAGIIRDEGQLALATSALDQLGVSSRSDGEDLGTLLQIRFDAILGTFDAFTQDFVAQADTLDAQVQRLADVGSITRELATGRGLGFDGVQETLQAVDALRIGGETLGAAFIRLRETMEPLDAAADLVSRALGQTREAALQFGSDLLAFFGDDAGQLGSALDTIFARFFSEEEVAGQAADAARARARELLTSLGLTVTDELLTEGGFRQAFDELFGTLGPEQTAILIQAGVAIDALLAAEEQLADVRGDAANAASREAELAEFLRSTGEQALQVLAPARLAYGQLIESIRESFEAARALKDSERALEVARLSASVQIQGFIAGLSQSITQLNQQLFGANPQVQQLGSSINTVANAAGNFRDQWLAAIDRIRDALDDQLTGTNSSLTNQQRLQEAIGQFNSALDAARGGDLNAAQNVPQLFNQAIGLGAGFYGTSTEQFAQLEAQLRNALESADLPVPPASPQVQTAANTAATATATQQIQQTAFDQYQAAISLIDQIGLLATLTETSPAEIGRQFGVPIAELMEILTGAAPEATGEVLDSMFNALANSIGEDLNELAGLEGINTDMLFELRGIRSLLGGPDPEGPPAFAGPAPDPGFYAGGIAGRAGRERIVVGEMGPEAVLSAEVTRGLQRAGIPVNSNSRELVAEVRQLRAQVTGLLSQINTRSLQREFEERERGAATLELHRDTVAELRKRSASSKPVLSRS